MKKFAIAVAAVAFACSASAQTLDHEERMVNRTAQKTAEQVKKTLVAYFSATGTTEKAAGIIADRTGGVLYEIRPASGYTSADLDWTDSSSRSSREMHDPAARPEIMEDLKDADSYDIIYIGYPIWWDLAPRVINTFIETYGFKGKTVYPFATSGGSTIANSVKVLTETYPEIDWKEGQLMNGQSR